ncbi:MAG: NAD(P)/FAD-dependent oxidoreductase [Desulfobacterales bacterium]|nr:NAD(P)/FAD-dependent oxidoreductase [Desulfobacterales bacterium]
MPVNDHYVIIGNGPAGNRAASTLRQKDNDAQITIVSDEAVPFYYKPKLTKYILDEIDLSKLMVKSLAEYSSEGIRVCLGQSVTKIDPNSKTIYIQQGDNIQYTKLIIASGSRHRILPSMERYASSLKFVTSYDQAMEYKDQIRKAKDVFAFGGDFVGFKFVRLLTKMEKNVSLLIYPNAFWPFNLTAEVTSAIERSLLGTGVDIIQEDDIKTIAEAGTGYRVVTQKGTEKQVDLVFSFNGLIPSIEFAQGSGLELDRGILVNEYLQTNIPDIYACGSCAQIFNPTIKAYTTSIGWPNAVSQGELAAMNLLGGHKVIQLAGRKYFDMEGVKIKTTWWEGIDEAEE